MEINKPVKPEIEFKIDLVIGILIAFIVLLIVFNHYQISNINSLLSSGRATGYSIKTFSGRSNKDLSKINLAEIKSTAHAVALLFPVDKIKTEQDAINIMISQGTPEYGNALGISYDDPVNSLDFLARRLYPQIKNDLQQNNPEIWQRYLNLATKPVGISCEFCCGVGPIGITQNGQLRCGCQHNPAAQAIAMWLMKNTDYSDAEVLREVLKWKSLWFPRNMVSLAIQVAGQDISSLQQLPGMVGGC
jgi:hypothetical protein